MLDLSLSVNHTKPFAELSNGFWKTEEQPFGLLCAWHSALWLLTWPSYRICLVNMS